MACTSVVFPVPSSPESPITVGATSSRPSASPNWLSASADRRMAYGVAVGPELEDLVAQDGGQLEIELFGGGLHLALEQFDERVALGGVGRTMECRLGGLGGLRVREARRESHLIHRLDDRARRDVLPLVVVGVRPAPEA